VTADMMEVEKMMSFLRLKSYRRNVSHKTAFWRGTLGVAPTDYPRATPTACFAAVVIYMIYSLITYGQ
jgi:hypothetical protein